MEPELAEKIYELDRCIECGCCVAACGTARMREDFVGAVGLNKIARFRLDPRDARSDDDYYELDRRRQRRVRLHVAARLPRRLPEEPAARDADRLHAPQDVVYRLDLAASPGSVFTLEEGAAGTSVPLLRRNAMNAETSPHTAELAAKPKHFYQSLYLQVITAIIIGVLLGYFYPHVGEAMKPLGDGFIKLIKMIIAPIIFCTVVVGIAGMEDMKKVGKTGGLALLYFEVVSTHRADHRPGDRQRRAARRRHERRRAHARHQGRRRLHRPRQDAGHGRLPAEHHPQHRRRRVRQGRDPAGAAVRGAVRLRAAPASAAAARWCST